MMAKESKYLISGTTGFAGFTKLIEPVPCKWDSISTKLLDNGMEATQLGCHDGN